MENSKLTELLRTFSPTELKEFEQFLKSPYFVKGRDLTKYYKLLIKYYPAFNISKSEISKKYFRGNSSSEDKKNKLLKTYNWELLKFADEFISVNYFKSNIFSKNEVLINEYLRRKLGRRADDTFNLLMKHLEEIKGDHYKYGNSVFAINAGTAAKRLVGKQNETFELFRMEAENLLKFFLHHSKYLLGCITVHQGQYNSQNKEENISGFLKNINLEKYLEGYSGTDENLEIQKMAVYNILILLYPENFKKYFPIVKQMLEKNVSQLGKTESLNYITLLLNFLSQNYNIRHSEMMFEITNFALDKGIYFEENGSGMGIFAFRRALGNALNLGEIKWAEKFVKDNLSNILPDFQKNMELFGKASIEHYKGNYEKSLMYISNYKMFDEVINYHAKELQIRNYYKLLKKKSEYFETLEYAIDAFKHYLSESRKVTDKFYGIGMNFLEGLNLLINFQYSESDKKKSDAIYKMKGFTPTTKNEWVVNEITGILNGLTKERKIVSSVR